jgi:hypothetical protein
MPATWPNGAQIEAGELSVLVATMDFKHRATAIFTYETPSPQGDATWRGEYFANRHLSGTPALVRQDREIHFLWGVGSPAQNIPADRFSVRWTRSVFFEEGAYRFHVQIDDGMRLWLDGRLILDEWSDHRAEHFSADVNVSKGVHALRVEYYENTLGARALVSWEHLACATKVRAAGGVSGDCAWGPPATQSGRTYLPAIRLW